MNQNQPLESSEELNEPSDQVRRWNTELEAAQKELEKWHKAAKEADQQYRDEKAPSRAETPENGVRVNLFWSNCQVLQSSLYARPPKVDVARRFKDFSDDPARVAGEMLERILNTDIESDDSDFDISIRQSIQDWIVAGLGQIWYRYEVETAEVELPPQVDPLTGAPIGEPQVVEQIVNEEAASDYIHWRDFFWSPARVWQEVRWVARRVYMTRDAMVKRFGEVGKLVPLQVKDRSNKGDGISKNDPWSRAEVYEIWCRDSKKVYWVVKGFDRFLDEKDDPLKLDGFFPCPKPALANCTTTSTVPRPDYAMVQDQYRQINHLATRIALLVNACKLVGVYDKQSDGVQRMLQQGVENQLIPVDKWAAFAESGGLKGQIDWLPIDQVAGVIGNLRQDMDAQKQQIYETLGLSDIMRGSTRPDETATAQQIKAQFGSSRMQFKQYELATFVRDAQRIKAEIVCKHFQPETIIERSNIMRTPDAQMAQQAVALLKDKASEPYRLNVESDSMATIDYASDRDAKTQFMQSVGQYISMVQPMLQQMPAAAPFLLQLMQWALSGFRVSKQIEGVIDQAITAASQPPPPPQPPQPTPDQQARVKELESRAKLNEARAQETAANTQAVQPKTMSEAQKNATQSRKNVAEADAEQAWAEAQRQEMLLKSQFPMGLPDFLKGQPGGRQ